MNVLRLLIRTALILPLIVFYGGRLHAQVCPPPDVPDSLYQDSNFDGIDGDTSHAIFVSTALGDDGNSGDMLSPVATIGQGILLASIAGKDVYVAGGTYTLASTLNLVSGVSVYGQYDGPPAWNRSASNTTTIDGPQIAVMATNLSADVHLEGFTINSADGTILNRNSYGIKVFGSAGGRCIIRYNIIKAGDGFSGPSGPSGAAGLSGGGGGIGGPGACDALIGFNGGAGGFSTCGRAGGAGGTGGQGSSNGANGGNGIGASGGFGFGGSGGPGDNTGFVPGGQGQNGLPGASGSNGSTAGPAPAMGNFVGGVYQPANGLNGIAGTPGGAGGGGGGGGGQSCFFCIAGTGNGGGGGGAGGCGASQGLGGDGGGGSFAIMVSDGGSVFINSNDITSGNGGSGGNGGNGAAGGSGGAGAPGASVCTSQVGAGGNGGAGGFGGHSGAGSGGSGGPSFCIAAGSPNVVVGSNILKAGFGGTGGAGGFGPLGVAPPGAHGPAVTTYGPVTYTTVVVPSICITDVSVNEPSSGSVAAVFTVYLSDITTNTVQVDYTTVDSSATSVGDYATTSGTLTFAPGEIFKQVTVQVNGDLISEPTEYFSLTLSNPQQAVFDDSGGVCTINNFALTSYKFSYPDRWSIVSLPVLVADPRASQVMPGIASGPSWYRPGSSYENADTLQHGRGFWIRCSTPQSFPVDGLPIAEDTIPVLPGWNLIGSIANAISINDVIPIPPELVVNSFYGYQGQYFPSDSLKPSFGYWVFASDSGTIVLRQPTVAHPKIVALKPAESWNTLIVTDASGATQRLYFGDRPAGQFSYGRHELPPIPPPGGFDARFASQRNLEVISHGEVRSYPVQISASSYPVVIRAEFSGSTIGASIAVNGANHSLMNGAKITVENPDDRVILTLDGRIEIPTEFSLQQNYPNPFNPSTIVTYGLPQNAMTTLRLYNPIGQEIRTLVNGVQEAGFHSITVRADDLPSGIYFYRLEAVSIDAPARQFTEVKKMILLK